MLHADPSTGRMAESERQVEGLFESLLAQSSGHPQWG